MRPEDYDKLANKLLPFILAKVRQAARVTPAAVTGDMSAYAIMAAVQSLDGAGSGLDADTVDGEHASVFLLATGSRAGATAQAQAFTGGVIAPFLRPAADSTAALQLQNAAGTPILTVDTTNKLVGIGELTTSLSFPMALLHIETSTNQLVFYIRASTNDGNNPLQFDQRGTGRAAYFYRDNAAPTRELFHILEDSPTAAQNVLYIRNDGVGNSLYIQRATAAERIYITASGDLSLGSGASPGAKLHVTGGGIFTSGIIINEAGGSAATDDLRAESDAEANMLWLDASADLLYLGGTVGVRVTKGGGVLLPVATKSGNYTLTTADNVVVFTATATALLPAATGSGQTYRLICRAGMLTIDGNGSDVVKGALTQTIYAGDDLIVTDTAAGVYE